MLAGLASLTRDSWLELGLGPGLGLLGLGPVVPFGDFFVAFALGFEAVGWAVEVNLRVVKELVSAVQVVVQIAAAVAAAAEVAEAEAAAAAVVGEAAVVVLVGEQGTVLEHSWQKADEGVLAGAAARLVVLDPHFGCDYFAGNVLVTWQSLVPGLVAAAAAAAVAAVAAAVVVVAVAAAAFAAVGHAAQLAPGPKRRLAADCRPADLPSAVAAAGAAGVEAD